jgi:uncharacterized protein
MVLGMNAKNGNPIVDNTDYLKQSINDIIKTPIGHRLMRRNYGSNIMAFADMPLNNNTLLQIQACLANALLQQEKNFLLKKVSVQQNLAKITVTIQGNYQDTTNPVELENIQLFDKRNNL